MNKELSLQTNEEYIKSLSVLKLKKHFGFITDDEFKESLIDLNIDYDFSDFTESISKNAVEMIINKIESRENTDDINILFNDEVEVYYDTYSLKRICEVILIDKEVIEVITILPVEDNMIYAFQDLETRLLGLAVINKFLPIISSDIIRLTIIQPNLMTLSVYESGIIDLLHDYEYSIM